MNGLNQSMDDTKDQEGTGGMFFVYLSTLIPACRR